MVVGTPSFFQNESYVPLFSPILSKSLMSFSSKTGCRFVWFHINQVCLVPYKPDYLDESVLWTESNDTGVGFRCLRMVNNIGLNFDAFHGDKDHGGVHDGTTVELWEWPKGKNQSRRIQLSLAILLLGVGIATVTDLQLNVLGSVLSLFAVVTTCIAQIMTNTIQKRYKVSSTQLLYQSCPYQALTVFIVGPFLDGLLTNQNVFAFHYTPQVLYISCNGKDITSYLSSLGPSENLPGSRFWLRSAS